MSLKPSFERRRRLKRPRILLLFGLVILIMPFTNYLGMSLKYRVHFYLPHVLLGAISFSEMIFIVSAFLAGLGLLLIKRWGWWLFVSAALVFIGRNVVVFVMLPHTATKGPLIHTLFVLAALIYFLQKDIFTPYLTLHRTGWRLLKRYPLEIDVLVNGSKHRTQNLSAGGMYVTWPDCPLSSGEEVDLEFSLNGDDFRLKGGIAMMRSGEGAGIAFRHLDREKLKRLKKSIVVSASSLKKSAKS